MMKIYKLGMIMYRYDDYEDNRPQLRRFRVEKITSITLLLREDQRYLDNNKLYGDFSFKTKRMHKEASNQFAFMKKEDALKRYISRKEYQLSCLKRQIKRCKSMMMKNRCGKLKTFDCHNENMWSI